ncbi:MAG TPA: hypothetical protein PKE47_15180, partial [Verrucomicrobiota bacterium]|nr:hypothetical protein [Verrucomicrobiota bacterium]
MERAGARRSAGRSLRGGFGKSPPNPRRERGVFPLLGQRHGAGGGCPGPGRVPARGQRQGQHLPRGRQAVAGLRDDVAGKLCRGGGVAAGRRRIRREQARPREPDFRPAGRELQGAPELLRGGGEGSGLQQRLAVAGALEDRQAV